jgi:hypothetical protein
MSLKLPYVKLSFVNGGAIKETAPPRNRAAAGFDIGGSSSCTNHNCCIYLSQGIVVKVKGVLHNGVPAYIIACRD